MFIVSTIKSEKGSCLNKPNGLQISRRGGYDGRKVYYNVNDNIYINRRPCAADDGGNKRGNCAVD